MPCIGENITNQGFGVLRTDVSRRDVITLQNDNAWPHRTLLTRNVVVGNIFEILDQLVISLGMAFIEHYNALKGGFMPVFHRHNWSYR